MAESGKEAPTTVKQKEKTSLMDDEIGTEFLSSWKSMSVAEDDAMDFQFEPVSKGKKNAFNFDKLDMDFSLDGDFDKIASFKVDMSDLDFSSAPKKSGKLKDRTENSLSESHQGKQDDFCFSFDFNDFGFESSSVKGEKKSKKCEDSEGITPDISEIEISKEQLRKDVNTLSCSISKSESGMQLKSGNSVAGLGTSNSDSITKDCSSKSDTTADLGVSLAEEMVSTRGEEAVQDCQLSEKTVSAEPCLKPAIQNLPVQSVSENDIVHDYIITKVHTPVCLKDTNDDKSNSGCERISDSKRPDTGTVYSVTKSHTPVGSPDIDSDLHGKYHGGENVINDGDLETATSSGPNSGKSHSTRSSSPTVTGLEHGSTELSKVSSNSQVLLTSTEVAESVINGSDLKDTCITNVSEYVHDKAHGKSCLSTSGLLSSPLKSDTPVKQMMNGLFQSKFFKRTEATEAKSLHDISPSCSLNISSCSTRYDTLRSDSLQGRRDEANDAMAKHHPTSLHTRESKIGEYNLPGYVENAKVLCTIRKSSSIDPAQNGSKVDAQSAHLNVEPVSIESKLEVKESRMKGDTPVKETANGLIQSKFFKRTEATEAKLYSISPSCSFNISGGSTNYGIMRSDSLQGRRDEANDAMAKLHPTSLHTRGSKIGEYNLPGYEENAKDQCTITKSSSIDPVENRSKVDGQLAHPNVEPVSIVSELEVKEPIINGSQLKGSSITVMKPIASTQQHKPKPLVPNMETIRSSLISSFKKTRFSSVRAAKRITDTPSLKKPRTLTANHSQNSDSQKHAKFLHISESGKEHGNIFSIGEQTTKFPSLKRKTTEESDVDLRVLNPPKRLSESLKERSTITKAQEMLKSKQDAGSNCPKLTRDFTMEVSMKDPDISLGMENDGSVEKAEACTKELEDICNMLKKKHDEAKELLVRAIVNNNNLLMLNHPVYEEKIQMIQKYAAGLMSKEIQT